MKEELRHAECRQQRLSGECALAAVLERERHFLVDRGALGADPENAYFRGEIDALSSAILICQLEFEPKPLVHDS